MLTVGALGPFVTTKNARRRTLSDNLLAFPLSPSDLEVDGAFAFGVYPLVPVDDPREPLPIEIGET